DYQQAFLGHVLDGPANAFATETGILDAAVGHIVDTPTGYVADHDAADLQYVPGFLCLVQVAGKDAGLQAEHGIIDALQHGIEIGEFFQHGHRAEGFLGDHGATVRHVFQQRRVEHGAIAAATAQQAAAFFNRFVDPVVQACGLALGNHRTDKGVFVFRVTFFQLLCALDQALLQFVVDLCVAIDALYADAALSGLVEGAEDNAFDGIVQVGILVDNTGGVAAEFQHHFFLAGARLQVPADYRRAGKAEQL